MFGFLKRLWNNPESPENLLNELEAQLDDLDKNKEYEEIGLKKGVVLLSLLPVLKNHELGITPRALLIYVKGWLQKNGKKMEDIVEEYEAEIGGKYNESASLFKLKEEVASEFLSAMNPSSSVSRAIPVGMAIREHISDKAITLIDLGSGRAHLSRIMLEPDMFDHEFLKKHRVHIENPSEQLANVERVVGIDAVDVDYETSVQIYPKDKMPEKHDLFEQIEAKGDHEGRYKQIIKDIRKITAREVKKTVKEGTKPVLYVGNLLFQVRGKIRKKLEKAINKLARKTGAHIVQMETWSAFYNQVPEETINGEAVDSPAYVKVGRNLSRMDTVAITNGTTGKPFDFKTKEGQRVHIDPKGNRIGVGETQVEDEIIAMAA